MEFEEFDIEFLAQKMSDNPQSPLFARLADLYLGKEKAVEAVNLTEAGIKLFPNYYAGYIVLGKSHLALNEFSKAITAFEKALELSPFNHHVTKLLQSVPNKSDESTRTTDENYFSQPNLPAVDQPEPVQETIEQNPVPAPVLRDNQFSTNSEEFSGSIYDKPIVQTSVVHQEEYEQTKSSEPFPSFDEYFATNQHRMGVDPVKKLDDYLNESQTTQVATPSSKIEPTILTTTTVEAVTTEPETHFVPEPVFSSPKQAQLFAEMQREELEYADENKQHTDLDSITEKLQSAEKIIPQENYQSTTPLQETTHEDQVYETDAVTPTLAEIYASQGELRAAIQAYEILMFSQPAKGAEFQKRIRELQQLQMEKDGFI